MQNINTNKMPPYWFFPHPEPGKFIKCYLNKETGQYDVGCHVIERNDDTKWLLTASRRLSGLVHRDGKTIQER